jgi:hypothetical protein
LNSRGSAQRETAPSPMTRILPSNFISIPQKQKQDAAIARKK